MITSMMAHVLSNWIYFGWRHIIITQILYSGVFDGRSSFAAAVKGSGNEPSPFPKPFRAKNGALPSKPSFSVDCRPNSSLHPHRKPVGVHTRPEQAPRPQRASGTRPAVFDWSHKEPSLGSPRPFSIRPGQMSFRLDGAGGAGVSVQPGPPSGRRTPALGLEFGGRRQRVQGDCVRRGGIHYLGLPDGLWNETLCKHRCFSRIIKLIGELESKTCFQSTEEMIIYSNVLSYSPEQSQGGLLRLDAATIPIECHYKK